VKEGRCDAVKLEGGKERSQLGFLKCILISFTISSTISSHFSFLVEKIVKGGVAVMGEMR